MQTMFQPSLGYPDQPAGHPYRRAVVGEPNPATANGDAFSHVRSIAAFGFPF